MEDAAMNIAPDVDPTCSFTVHVLEQRVFFFFFFVGQKVQLSTVFSLFVMCMLFFEEKLFAQFWHFVSCFFPLKKKLESLGRQARSEAYDKDTRCFLRTFSHLIFIYFRVIRI